MKKQGNIFQTEKQDKSPAIDLNETWTSNLLNREFKTGLIKMLTKVRKNDA